MQDSTSPSQVKVKQTLPKDQPCFSTGCQSEPKARCEICGQIFCRTHGRVGKAYRPRCEQCLGKTFTQIVTAAKRAHRLDDAVSILTPWADGELGVSQARRALGLIRAQNGDLDGALELLEPLVNDGGNSQAFFAALAQIYLRRGANLVAQEEMVAAATDVAEALRLNPQLVEAQRALPLLRNWRVVGLIRAGDLVSASRVWEEEFSRDPTDLTLTHHLGILYYQIASRMEAQAQQGQNVPGADAYWRKTLACWAVVLRNPDFGQTWRAQRRADAKLEIKEEEWVGARTAMEERLLRDFRDYASKYGDAGRAADAGRFHELEVLWGLELYTAKQIREYALEFRVNGWLHGFGCGPLMLEQLGALPATKDNVANLRRAALTAQDAMGKRVAQLLSPMGRYYFLIQERRLDQAIEELEKVSAWPQTKEYLGLAYAEKGRELADQYQWEDAVGAFEKASANGADLRGDSARLAEGASKCARQMLEENDDEYARPVQLLERTLKVVGNNTAIRENLAAMYAQQARIANNADRFEEAARLIRIALQYDSSEQQTRHWARITMANWGASVAPTDPDRAIMLVKEGLSYEQNEETSNILAIMLIERGINLARAKNRQRAIECVRESFQYSPGPDHPPTVEAARAFLKGFWHKEASEALDKNQYSQAVDAAREALQYVDNSDTRQIVAVCLFRAGRQDDAIQELRGALARDRSNQEVKHQLHVWLHNRAVELANADRHDSAIDYFRQSLELENSPDTRRMLAQVYGNRAVTKFQRGDSWGAKQDLQEALKYDPRNSDIRSALNRIS